MYFLLEQLSALILFLENYKSAILLFKSDNKDLFAFKIASFIVKIVGQE